MRAGGLAKGKKAVLRGLGLSVRFERNYRPKSKAGKLQGNRKVYSWVCS